MRLTIATIILLLINPLSTFAQQPPFSPSGIILPPIAYSACVWGDYSHEGNLDLALTGTEGNIPVTKIFHNEFGTLTEIQSNLRGLHFGSAEWGDYDHDGDLDLLVTGIESSGTPHTIIFKNTNGSFSDSGIDLPGVMDGQASWGDIDNDGNLDILLTGSSMAQIYRNNGYGEFVNINAPLPDIETTMACWNDYNNDGQADVLVCGNTGGGIVSSLFKNDHGVFTEVSISPEPFLGLYGGQAKWADLDNDGDQDLVIAGMDLYVDGYFLVYRNEGNDHFTRFDINSANLLNPAFDLADYDADGLTDIILIGTTPGCGGPAVTMLLKNEGLMNFSIVSSLLPGYKLGAVAWADFNNDGFSDLLFTGLDAFDVPKTEFYLNNLGNTLYTLNTPPDPPQGLSMIMESGKAVMHWNSSSDIQTPQKALTYNIRVGTVPFGFDIMSPLCDSTTGFRTVSAPGNAGSDTSWFIAGIPAGTYYFSVQAIDNGFGTGTFSAPCMFNYIPAVDVETHESAGFSISPNPCHDYLQIKGASSGKTNLKIRIIDVTGKQMYEGIQPEVINISSWPNGIYVLQHTDPIRTGSIKFIKE